MELGLTQEAAGLEPVRSVTPISLAPVRSEGGPGLQHLESPHVTAPGTTDPTHLIATTLIEPGKADRRAAAAAHVDRGIALATAGQTEAAIAAYRAALRLRPDDAAAYLGFGSALQRLGEHAEALVALRKAHALGAAKPGWPYPTAQWVREAERMAALDARPPDLRRGEDRPDDPEEVLLTRPHLQH